MNFDSEYKKEIDKLCNDNFKMTDSEILKLAKNNTMTETERNITMKKRTKISMITKTVAAAAACLIVSGTAVYAMESGTFSEVFRSLFHDDISAELVEQGHGEEVNKTVSQDGFEVTVFGLTGDWEHIFLAMDVLFPEGEMAERTDHISVYTLLMTEEEHQGDLTDAAHWYAEADPDPENPRLYHVNVPIQYGFIEGDDQELVFDLRHICRYFRGLYAEELDFDQLIVRFPLPEELYKPVKYSHFKDVFFNCDDVDYQLLMAAYGSYNTEFTFYFDIADTKYYGMGYDCTQFCSRAEKDWRKIGETAVLNVDGTEYSVLTGETDVTAWGDPTIDNEAYACMCFPAIDYENAEYVSLTILDKTLSLKPNEAPDPDYWDYYEDVPGAMDPEVIESETIGSEVIESKEEYYENGNSVITDDTIITEATVINGPRVYYLDTDMETQLVQDVYFRLVMGCYADNITEFTFYATIEDIQEQMKYQLDEEHVYDWVTRHWIRDGRKAVLNVDGVEYPVKHLSGDERHIEFTKGTETRVDGCAKFYFDPIDMKSAENITLTFNDTTFVLKSADFQPEISE